MKKTPAATTATLLQALGLSLVMGGGVLLAGCDPARGTGADKPVAPAPHVQAANPIDAGRYLVRIGGCNDCHTPGYEAALGDMPEQEWLTGSPIGFRGPWGTSYPSNLRLLLQEMPEDVFVELAHSRTMLPPMPWPSLNNMNEQDVRAIYQFIRSLGPKGEQMPMALDPGEEPTTPYFDFEPQHMERLAAAGPPSADASTDAD